MNHGIDAHLDPVDDRHRIGLAMSRMRLMIGRRIIGRLAIENVAPDLDLSHIDVLDAVRRIGPVQEVTVGAIAEIMRIDPSRASRIVADMVGRGVLKRAASQADARRIVVVLTPRGQNLLTEIRRVKNKVMDDIVADWPEEDVTQFARLFETFVDRFEKMFPQRDKTVPATDSS